MALALYRKYRPASFGEVRGQDHVTEPLMHALTNNRTNHAYLFSGPRGCGKTSSARILARSLNCAQGPTPTPCNVCESCVALAPDGPGSLDVIEIDAATHGLVDDARELRERAHFAPVSNRFKIYIIDEAHMLGPGAANALLKVIEEPPEFVVFVLATTESDKLIITIRSRTHHYPFRLVPPGVLRTLLEDICTRENVAVEPTVFPLVVRAGGGSVRDSLSIMDQLLAGAGDAGVTYAHALGLLGVTDTALLDEVVDALSAGDGASVFEVVDRVVEAGHDPRRFAGDLLERLRNLIILDAVPDAAATSLIDGPVDQLERMVGQASRLSGGTLSRLADIVHDGLTEMRGTTSPRLLLELICARMLLPAVGDETSGLIQRIERLERRAEIGTSAPVSAQPPAAGSTSPKPSTEDRASSAPGDDADVAAGSDGTQEGDAVQSDSSPPTAESAEKTASSPPSTVDTLARDGGWDVAGIRRVWPDIVAAAKSRRQTVGAYLLDATVSGFDGSTLTLSFPHAFHAKALQGASSIFDEALDEVLGVRWALSCEVGGSAVGSTVPRSQPPPKPVAAAAPVSPPADDRRIDLDDEAEPEPADDPSEGAPDQVRSAEEAAMDLLSKSLGARQISEDGRA